MNLLKAILALCIMLGMLCPPISLSTASSGNSVIRVPGDYNSIQAAAANAPEGSTIFVSPGRFVEHLTIDKRLNITGSGNSTVIENDGLSTMTIDVVRGVNGVTLADFFVNSTNPVSTIGIYVAGGDCSLRNVTVANHGTGIFIWDSSGDVMRNDLMVNNTHNLEVWGLTLSQFMHDIDYSNLVDGRRVYYWVNESDKVVPADAGYVAIINSANITIKDVRLTRNYSGILLAHSNNCRVLNATCSSNREGILIVLSDNNTIVDSRFDLNEWTGISSCASSDNYIAGNTVSAGDLGNLPRGIFFYCSPLLPERSDDNDVCGNLVSQNYYGVYIDSGSGNQVCNNEIINNTIGVRLDSSAGNVFVNNSLSQSTACGVQIDAAGGNSFYHNSFLDNTLQVSYVEETNLPTPVNEWNDSYPHGGNYWSDYSGVDAYSGEFQNETGSDGIGDAPYQVYLANSDRYPLMAVPEKSTRLNVNFSISPREPRLFDLVNFVDATGSSSSLSLLLWVFSDGQVFRSQNVSRQFVQAGNYTAVLYAVDNEGVTSFALKTFQVRKIFSMLTLAAPSQGILREDVPIGAELKDEDSLALVDGRVDFFVVRKTSQEWIGSSTTNSSGIAVISHSFNETGLSTVYAEYDGNQTYAPSDSQLNLSIVDTGTLSPVLIVAIASFCVIVVLVLLYAYRRRRKP